MIESAPSSPAPQRSRARTLASFAKAGAPFLLCLGTCNANFLYMVSAPPVRSAVAYVESSDAVRAAIGDGADVSLVVTRSLDRDFIHRGGRDRVFLITTVDGSRGEATLHLDAQNVDGQGWAGSFSVEASGRQELHGGRYETVGGGTIVSGSFAPDGSVGGTD